jgi:hypothetical protein
VSLRTRPITLRAARAYVDLHHRHNEPSTGWLFGTSVVDPSGTVVGVGIAGRPVAQALQDGLTVEITRCCTEGYPNAASMIYGALCRAAKALGYEVAITYTLAGEAGTSLRAAGFVPVADVEPRESWSRRNRIRHDLTLFGEKRRPTGPKVRWERRLAGQALTLTAQRA